MHRQMPQPNDFGSLDQRLVLLTMGLLPPSLAQRSSLPSPQELVDMLVERRRRMGARPWPWRLRTELQNLVGRSGADALLAQTGALLVARAAGDPHALRLELNLLPDADPVAVSRQLLEAGSSSAFVRLRDEGDLAWSWPLRIAAGGGSGLFDDLAFYPHFLRFLRRYDLDNLALRANLAFHGTSLAECCARLESTSRRQEADALVVLGGLGAPEDEAAGLVARARRLSGAQAVVVFMSPDPQRHPDLVTGLIAELSHDLPLDAAAAAVERGTGVPVLVWATRSIAEVTSVRYQGRRLALELQKMETEIGVPEIVIHEVWDGVPEVAPAAPPTLEYLDLDATVHSDPQPPAEKEAGEEDVGPRVRTRALGEVMHRRLPSPAPFAEEAAPPEAMSFDHESGGAGTVAELAEAAAGPAAEVRRQRPRRHFQARVRRPRGRWIEPDQPLRPGRPYETCVKIAAPDPEWLALAEPLDEPPPKPDGSPINLQIMFWEPALKKGPLLRPLKLYPRGDTGLAVFPFTAPAKERIFAARIAIYHRNRVLQTGVLRGQVGTDASNLSFQLDAMPVPRFLGLEDRAGVGASIIFNCHPNGTTNAVVRHDGQMFAGELGAAPAPTPTVDEKFDPFGINVGQISLLDDLISAVGAAVSRIATNPDDFDGIRKDGTTKLLVELARRGRALLRFLKQHTMMEDQLDKVKDLQIVQASFKSSFPVEYLYTGEMPRAGAKICTCFDDPKNIRTGEPCPKYDKEPKNFVCPNKFWSMSKVIERHAHTGRHTMMDQDFFLHKVPASDRDRVLRPLAGAVLATSRIADEAAPKTTANLHRDLESFLEGTVPLTKTWTDWEDEIIKTKPHLLVMLPHHGRAAGCDFLEIGENSRRDTIDIEESSVQPKNHPEINPVVLLIGCKTDKAKLDLESAVGQFQSGGAAIIVSTLATILGRHAGPAASVIVDEMKKVQDKQGATFGMVMLAARRRLLAEGVPMVLGLTSYGDADCRIVSANT